LAGTQQSFRITSSTLIPRGPFEQGRTKPACWATVRIFFRNARNLI